MGETQSEASGRTRHQAPMRCTFCLKTRREVRALVVSGMTGAYICDECVAWCVEILGDRMRPHPGGG